MSNCLHNKESLLALQRSMPVNRAFQRTACRKYFFKMRLKKIIYPHFRPRIPALGPAMRKEKTACNRKNTL